MNEIGEQPEHLTFKTPNLKTIWITLGGLCVVAMGLGSYMLLTVEKEPTSNVTQTVAPTTEPAANFMREPENHVSITKTSDTFDTYTNEGFKIAISYPNTWQAELYHDQGIFLTPKEEHEIGITIYRVTGFGYCYKYAEPVEFTIQDRVAKMADGIGGTTFCENQDVDMTNKGNTYVLVPVEKDSKLHPPYKVHIMAYYPLDEIDEAKEYLSQVLDNLVFY